MTTWLGSPAGDGERGWRGGWSGGRLEGDLVTQRLELAHEVAGLAGLVDAAGVVVSAEVVEAGGGVGQQVPDDHQDGAGDGDQGLALADAPDQAAVALAQGKVSVLAAAVAASPSAALR